MKLKNRYYKKTHNLKVILKMIFKITSLPIDFDLKNYSYLLVMISILIFKITVLLWFSKSRSWEILPISDDNNYLSYFKIYCILYTSIIGIAALCAEIRRNNYLIWIICVSMYSITAIMEVEFLWRRPITLYQLHSMRTCVSYVWLS